MPLDSFEKRRDLRLECEGGGCRVDRVKDDKGLAAAAVRLHRDDLDDLAVRSKQLLQHLLQLRLLDLLVNILQSQINQKSIHQCQSRVFWRGPLS